LTAESLGINSVRVVMLVRGHGDQGVLAQTATSQVLHGHDSVVPVPPTDQQVDEQGALIAIGAVAKL
jgi:hypothetical protein